ncbi:hypothetical protein A0H76_327 [Hepatospora eriocheir]|uniref:Uncharacterized protein n=1 Tax=Hepatospora eriocheir TaxID=1081669 RepID=A0A1X0QAA4_9MICR|nr:hypothetical protein HERIO_1436 [Hepatospora eriocheir]ORD99714.1 hypothetical protein A0H76_327 [Hepatospora eriocheir]
MIEDNINILKVYDPVIKKIKTYKIVSDKISIGNMEVSDMKINSPEFEIITMSIDFNNLEMIITNKITNSENVYYLNKEFPLVRVHTFFFFCKPRYEIVNETDDLNINRLLEQKINSTPKTTKRAVSFKDVNFKDVLINLSASKVNSPVMKELCNKNKKVISKDKSKDKSLDLSGDNLNNTLNSKAYENSSKEIKEDSKLGNDNNEIFNNSVNNSINSNDNEIKDNKSEIQNNNKEEVKLQQPKRKRQKKHTPTDPRVPFPYEKLEPSKLSPQQRAAITRRKNRVKELEKKENN